MFRQDRDVRCIDVTNSNPVITNISSKGNQRKWKKGELFIKLDQSGYESTAEVLVSHLLSFTDITDYVTYYPCTVKSNDVLLGNGCYSKDFKGVDEEEITLGRLMANNLISFGSDYETILDFIYDLTGSTHKEYIDKILCLDAITSNDDRHFNNFSFLKKDGVYRPAPVFDNGASCLSDMFSYPATYPLLYSKTYLPFKSDPIKQLEKTIPLIIDDYGFKESVELKSWEAKRAFDVIMYGLKRMEGIAWIKI